ncbi:MAG TPA: LLM class flavin-dependent oxidoreductase [Candidatus Binataceae bacterium]|nr:LLM class flavin-dependent oxidoreductase [Candidatus Binataceae bacterium]
MKRNYWEIVQAMPAAELTRLMRRFEDLGLYGVWVPQLHAPPFPTMAAIAMATTRMQIGSGIAFAFTRSPLETALNALDIDRLSGGRTVLGLGTSVRTFNERAHGATYGKPVAHLREVVEAVRAIIERGATGQLGELSGEYHKLDLRGLTTRKPVRASIPIWVPALFKNTIVMGAKTADGVMGHPIWSLKAITESSKIVDETLAAAGRPRAQFHVNIWNYAAVSNDRKQAIDDMRGTVANYSSIPQYEKFYEAHGFGDAARAVIAAASRGDTAAMLKAVPDEMVTTFAIAGTPDEAGERVEKIWPHADSMTISPPQYFVPPDRLNGYRDAIINTFYKA